MMRLLRVGFVQVRSLPFLLRFSYDKQNKKGFNNKLFKHAKNEKEQERQTKLNLGKRFSKDQKITTPSSFRQQQNTSKSSHDDTTRKHTWLNTYLPSLIPSQYLLLIEKSLSTTTQFKLEDQWKRGIVHKEYMNFSMSNYELIGKIIPKILEFQVPVSRQLMQNLMENFFCSHIIVKNPPDQMTDTIMLEFLSKNKELLENFYTNARIKLQLRFYSYLKELFARRRAHSNYRSLISSYNFAYRALQSNLHQVDFAEQSGRQIIDLFIRALKHHPINNEDQKLINCICSQVPFFPQTPLIYFLQHYPALLQKVDFPILLNILEAAKMQGFENISTYQFMPLIGAFYTLQRRNPDVINVVEELLALLFGQLFRKRNPKFTQNFILEILVELSKLIELKPNTPNISQFFAFLRSLIEELPQSKELEHDANLLFEVFATFISNKFLKRNVFPSEMRSVESALQRTAGRQKELQRSYLWDLLKGEERPLQVFNGAYMLELCPKKQVDYIHQILQLDEIDFTKSLLLMLVDSQGQALLPLKRMLSEFDYQLILNKLNLSLLRHHATDFYKEIFCEVMERMHFSKMIIDLLDSLYRLQKKGKAEGFDEWDILHNLLENAMQKVYNRPIFTRTFISLISILEFYINNLHKSDLLLKQPYFYYLLKMMLKYVRSNTEVTQFKINIFRMLDFVLKQEQAYLNQYLQLAVRNFTIEKDDYERMKSHIDIYTLEHNLVRFQLDHHILPEEIPKIYDKILKGMKVTETQQARINKLVDPSWMPQSFSKETLVAYFMDDNVLSLLADHMKTVQAIIKQASLQELAYYLYNFNSKERNVKSNLFKMIWQAFNANLQELELPFILNLTILYKYSHIDDSLYMPYFNKVLRFCTLRPHHCARAKHSDLLTLIRHRSRNILQLHPEAEAYIAILRKYLLNNLKYLSSIHKFGMVMEFLQLGYALDCQQIESVESKLLEHDFAAYFIVQCENSMSNKIEILLEEYLKRRNKRRISDRSQVEIYISLKYPKLKKYLQNNQGILTPLLKEISNKSMGVLNRLHLQYKDLQMRKKLHCVVNAHHLIAFYPTGNRPFYLFLQKLYQLQPTTKNLQIHLFDIAELAKPLQFYAMIEAKGIVGARSEAEIEKEKIYEESPEERLAKAVASIAEQEEPNVEKEQIPIENDK